MVTYESDWGECRKWRAGEGVGTMSACTMRGVSLPADRRESIDIKCPLSYVAAVDIYLLRSSLTAIATCPSISPMTRETVDLSPL